MLFLVYNIYMTNSKVSIIIPIYNSADTLEGCLRSIDQSTYPNKAIRIFLVNNLTRDNSFEVYTRCQELFPELHMQWLNAQQGKSRALNLALYNSEGKYIIHIDSDGALEPHALANLVDLFEADLTCNCVTGSILTDPEKVEEYSGPGLLLRRLEFMEYAQAFLAGRNYASETNPLRGFFRLPQVRDPEVLALQHRHHLRGHPDHLPDALRPERAGAYQRGLHLPHRPHRGHG